ncbi:MAG: peroxidase [Acidobacteriota bacterium]
MLKDFRTAPIDEPRKALFAFIEKLTRESNRIRQEDIDTLKTAGWTEEAIYDAVTVCALFNFYTTWVDATGVREMPAAVYAMSGKRLAGEGYIPPGED